MRSRSQQNLSRQFVAGLRVYAISWRYGIYPQTSHKLRQCLCIIGISLWGWACSSETHSDTHNASLTTYSDTAFQQEYHEPYPVGQDEKANDIRSISVDRQGVVWIATGAGIFSKKADQNEWMPMLPATKQGPAFSVVVDNQSVVWVGTWNGLYRYKNNLAEHIAGLDAPISTVAVAQEGVYALGPLGVWLINAKGVQKKNFILPRSIRNALSDSHDGLWVTTDVGLYHVTDQASTVFQNTDQL